jgi:uncharacterized repeat protein (TIGR01451 family)
LSVLVLLLFASIAHAQNTISTVAGSAAPNNVSPTAASIEGPVGVVRDGSGNLYVLTDSGVVYKVTIPPTGAPSTLVIFAGNSDAGHATSGIQATAARTDEPDGGALDANGNFYFADGGNCVIREVVAATGIINTVVGNGTCGFSGDNGPATSAELNFPQGIAFDGSGDLFIADINNNVIRRVDGSTKVITTYAGTGAQGFNGDNGPATSATFRFPQAVATDANGNLFIADTQNNVIRRVDVGTKVITTVVGTGTFGYSGDGGLATAATMQDPGGIVVDASENLYIADSGNAVVRKVTAATNIITTIIGNHGFGFGGDGGPALSATLTNPFLLAVDSATGNVWIPDYWNNRIRLYSPGNNNEITTVVGNGLVGDGGPATEASFYDPRSPILDSQGNLYIVDAQNNRIRKVDTSQNISTVVGNGIVCPQPQESCGDGGAPLSASLNIPRTVTIDPSGNLIIADSGDNRIREVTDGNITTIAGTGPAGFSGDGGPATSAELNNPRGVVLDSTQNIYFVDAVNNRVRRIDATTGDISTIAGNGVNGNAPSGCQGQGSFSGDGGPAISATLNCPLGLDIDSKGNLFVSDTQNSRIRRIDAVTQIITTVAGNGTAGFSGDGGAATSAMLNNPDRISINAAGNFFISDTNNQRIRRVDGTTGIITTFAGNGNFGFAGDGGPAVSASFSTPTGVVVTSQGNMYVGDLLNNRIRLVLLNPNVTISSSSAPFGNQPISVGATPLPVTVTNSGDAPLTISSIALTGASVFSLATSATPCPVAPATLAVGANCVIEVAFTPTQFVASTGTITITDNAPTTTQTINVSGTGAAALTVQVTAGTGSVSSSPAGITACATTCTANFTGNSSVILTAAPGTNFTFSGFTNCASTGALTCSVTMSAAETVTAAFTSSGGGGGGLTISPNTLPNGAIGAPYGQTLAVSGGTAPYNFTISAGALPAGLTLGATSGTIAGVPTGPAGAPSFAVHVTDSSATPLTGSASLTITITAADASNNAELNGSYALLFQGFIDSDGTMVVAAGSLLADGHGNISPGGFVDADGSTGVQPTQEITSGTYTIGADNRGTMSLAVAGGGGITFAFSVGDIQSGVATKARIIRFDDVSGTNGTTGSGVLLKQDPSIFALNALHGSYAFGESGTDLTNGDPESGVGFVNADGNGNFTTGGLVDLDDGGAIVPSAAISGTYALTNETVSSGRLSASITIAGVNGTTSQVLYIVSASQVVFISINATTNSIFSGMAQLQVPPTGGFGLSSLINNSVVAVQGRQADGSPIVLIGSLATDGNGIFALSYVQNNGDTSVSATAGGTYAVDTNSRAKLTYTSGGFAPTIMYLDGLNQGFAAATDANASSGPLDPGVSSYNNATLSTSDNFFFGTVAPASNKNTNESGVASFGATTVQSVADDSGPGGALLGDIVVSQSYDVATNGQLSFGGRAAGYVASGCKIELVSNVTTIPGLTTAECQVLQSTLTVTEAGTGTGTVSSSPVGITCPATTCSASFESGTQVVLTATPTGGSTFGSFTTNCIPANPQTNPPSCTIAMSGSPTVAVTFTAGSGIPPALAITKSHTGNFTQGQQNATYTVTVSNGANAGPTSGTITVTDTIPAGLTLVSMVGTGWACAANTCTNSTVLGAGASSTITVTVNVASNAAASVTNAVSVSGGGSAAANATNPTTITTSGGGGSGIATVNPNPLAFGGVQVSVSSALSFTLQNTGTGPLGSIAFSVTNPDYTITTNTCATTLAAGSAACTITVTFTPSFQAPDTGAVVITDDSSAGPTTELLSGVGVGPIYVLPFEMFYDGITPGTTSPAQTATLFNTTDTVLSVTGVTFVGNAASDFSVTSNGCGDGADPSCPIGVAFTPSTTVLGPRTADLTIATNSETTPSVVSHLTGNGAIQHLPGFTANSFPPNDDDSTSAVNLPFSMNFFGTTYNQLYVNNNGNVTFGEPFGTYTPFGLTGNIGVPIIAPFFADVYTLTPGSDVVHYGVDTVNGQQAFGVNWENVAYYAEPDGEDCPPAILLNSFQLIVIARPDTGAGNFDMEFNYDKIQWETGTASGGVCGLGGSSAAVGYSNGTGDAGTNFQLPGSLVNGAFLDVPTAAGFPGLIHSDLSSTMLGRYEFQVRNGAVQSADLGLTMTQSANPVPAGSNQTYTLTVTNAGPSDATNTTVSDTLPTNATLVSATPSQGAACAGTVTLTCNLGTVANAGTATVTIVVTVNAGATGTVVNNASVTSDLPDPNPGNNTASASATIGASTNVLLTIIPGGNGTGTVRSTPAGINCGATCSVNFPSGTTVVLTATPSDGSTFTGWGAGPCEGTGTCTITLTSPPTTVSVVANFAQSTNNFTLAVNEAGTGTGTVTSSPAGIVCPPAATCSASFTSGQVVTLTATPTNGSTFAGWSGVAGCPGTGTCTVTVSAAVTVTATFNSGTSPVTIGLAPGSPSTVNTTPGSSAVFGLTLTSLPGVTGTVTLGCTVISPNAADISCNLVPKAIVLTGKAINVAIVVNTFCKGAVPPFGPSLPGGLVGGLGMLLAGMSLCGAMWTLKRRPRWALSFGVLVLIAVGMSACSSLPKSPGGQATPPGSYNLVVTATAPNGATSSVPLTLVVGP